MKHGPEPLEVERFEYARNYKTLIEKQLARVEITCETPGATSEDLFQYRRKWPVAVPWLVVGVGAAVAAGSGYLHMQSRDSFRAFDFGITECGGCVPAPDVSDRLSRGNTYQNVAIGGYAVGGAALLTGAVLAFLNQPEAYRVDQKPAETVNVTPLVGGGTTGVLTTFRF
jgi:hypothetical protein